MTLVPPLGERVGAGAMSEVFAWDEGRVVKLFLAAYDFAVERELECARAVNEAGVASPAVHEVVEVDGRRGIVYDRVDGPTLLDQLLRAERSPRDVGRTLAGVHLAMHAVAVPGLADLAAVIRAQDPNAEVPAGDIVFHGDFHPGNVISGPAGPVTWPPSPSRSRTWRRGSAGPRHRCTAPSRAAPTPPISSRSKAGVTRTWSSPCSDGSSLVSVTLRRNT